MSFSESKQNLQYLSIQRRTLLRLGIDLNAKKGKELLIHYCKFFLIQTLTIYLQCCLINFVLDSIPNIDVTIAPLSIFTQCFSIIVKFWVFFYKGDKFLNLIWQINQLADNADCKESKKWLSQNQRSHLITKIFHHSSWLALICSCFLPLISMAYDYYNAMEIVKKLPFGGKFPFDNGSILYFLLNYMLSVFCGSYLTNMTVSIDSLFGWYIHSISAHFQILRIKVEHVASKIENDNHADFIKDVGCLVSYHNKILRFVGDLNNIFGEIILMEVMLSCLVMCYVIFTLNNDADISNMPFNVAFIVALVIQRMIYCFGGEKLKNESELLCDDFYLQFPWHKMSPQEKKLMLLPLMRSQRQTVLTGLVFVTDRNLLVYILRTTFSYNALLSAIKER